MVQIIANKNFSVAHARLLQFHEVVVVVVVLLLLLLLLMVLLVVVVVDCSGGVEGVEGSALVWTGGNTGGATGYQVNIPDTCLQCTALFQITYHYFRLLYYFRFCTHLRRALCHME